MRLRDLTIADADRLDAWAGDPDVRGRGFGSEAQRLLADYLFAATPLDRAEASTHVNNIAEQRSLEKAGFVREGLLRGAQMRRGVRYDLINFARLRTDP